MSLVVPHPSIVRCILTMLSLLTAATAGAQQAPLWRNDTKVVQLESQSVAEIQSALLASRESLAKHRWVELARPATELSKRALRESGVALLTALGGRHFFAKIDNARLDVDQLLRSGALLQIREIELSSKMHPSLWQGTPPEWSKSKSELDDSTYVAVQVLLHAQAPLEHIDLIAARHAGTVTARWYSTPGAIIEVPWGSVRALAAEDIVQWIEPPLPAFGNFNDSNRAASEANAAQSGPYNLTGAGITALIYDGGTVLANHDDFSGRAVVRDGAPLSDHSTHVAATVGGDGSASGGTFRGMAPSVKIESYGLQFTVGGGTALYSNPGDFESDFNDAINLFGADVANCSIGANIALTGQPCGLLGDYGVMAGLIDNVVRGSLGSPMRIIWAAGNERGLAACGQLYNQVPPPVGAKNHISVGALNSNNDTMTSFSSWGPTDDGRLVPVITAPGCQSNGDNGVTSASSTGTSAYAVLCGTSMAAPTVTGITALLLEDYRDQFPGIPDPRNSTLKALYAHTAVDLGSGGPDYQFGYGKIDATAAIDQMRTGQFLEDQLGQGDNFQFTVDVTAGTPELKVTVAWDDVAAAPNVVAALVNDLDIHVTSPSGARAYPWVLDPANPATPAAQGAADRLNNIEQVFVANPEVGVWTVEVFGYSVPDGPQPFSLVADSGISALVVALPDGAPTLVPADTSTEISVRIVTIDDTVVPGSELFHYRLLGGSFTSVPLDQVSSEFYKATLPGPSCASTPEFYVSAQGVNSGLVTVPSMAPAEFFSSDVGEVILVSEDNLESSSGWVLGSSDDDAISGLWVHDEPTGTAAQPSVDHSPNGTFCFVTGQGPVGGPVGSNDVDFGKTTLMSPAYDLAGLDARISYWRWFSNGQGVAGNDDVFNVDISADNGQNWVSVEVIGPTGAETNGGWIYHQFRVLDFIIPTSQVRLRFVARDDDPQSIVEAAIDDVVIDYSQCLGNDCNSNNIVDADEIAGGAPDVNGNGVLDECECLTPLFIRGDVNNNGSLQLADGIRLLEYLFLSGPAPDEPLARADVNGNQFIDISDVVFLLSYLFDNGADPAPPFPGPGC